MSHTEKSRKDLASTYFVPNSANKQELARLQILNRMTTTNMGGVLAEQSDPTLFERVLDVGCGTGGWLLEVAKTYPTIKLLVGVDINPKKVEFARSQAKTEHLSERVEFHVMDVMSPLDFPTGYFDLINQRYAQGHLRTWDWAQVLQEFHRVSRPGGVIRVTESNFIAQSTSPALLQLSAMATNAYYASGRFFTPTYNGLTSQLGSLLLRYGLREVQAHIDTLSYQSGTPQGKDFYEQLRLFYRTIEPFLRKWINISNDYETIYQQALKEMQMPNFSASWDLLTVWGTSPGYNPSKDPLRER